jgi:hypothetical protein
MMADVDSRNMLQCIIKIIVLDLYVVFARIISTLSASLFAETKASSTVCLWWATFCETYKVNLKVYLEFIAHESTLKRTNERPL